MPTQLHDARRAPRFPVRLPVEVSVQGESWAGEIEDLSASGCLLRSSRPLRPGCTLRLLVRTQELTDTLNVSGSVAWASRERGGVAFTSRQAADPRGWVDRYVAACPRLATLRGHAPAVLDLAAPLYFLPAPRVLVDLSDDELAVLRQAENGVRAGELLRRAGLDPERGRRAVLGLFEKNVLTLALGRASDPWRWRALLPRADQGALPQIVRTSPLPAAPAERARIPPPSLSRAALDQPPASTRHAGASALPGAPAFVAPPHPAAPAELPALDRHHGRPVPHASAAEVATLLRGNNPARRPAQAQARFDQAMAASQEGRVHDAVALLRQALVLSPRDPEIARILGELAFKDRQVS